MTPLYLVVCFLVKSSRASTPFKDSVFTLKSSSRRYLEFGALCLLAVAILWWFGRKLNWLEVRQAVGNANPYLLALAALVISLAYLFRAARWGALLAPLSPAGLRNLFVATTVGFSAVFLFGRTGEVVRP